MPSLKEKDVDKLLTLSSLSWGYVTRRSIAKHFDGNAINDLISSEAIRAVWDGAPVFRVTSSETPLHPFPMTYVLWLVHNQVFDDNTRIVISHASAARIHKLIGTIPGVADTISYESPRDVQLETLPDFIYPPSNLLIDPFNIQVSTFMPGEIIEKIGILVTSPIRTLVDILNSGVADREQLALLITRLLEDHNVTTKQIGFGLSQHCQTIDSTEFGIATVQNLLSEQ